jgi:ubiquinone biosynthesis protein UbiJ
MVAACNCICAGRKLPGDDGDRWTPERRTAAGTTSGSQLRVAATPGSLLAMLFKRDDDGISPGKVDIAGDAELARRLEKLASKFAPDFEEAFARTFGDVLGVPLAKAVRKG